MSMSTIQKAAGWLLFVMTLSFAGAVLKLIDAKERTERELAELSAAQLHRLENHVEVMGALLNREFDCSYWEWQTHKTDVYWSPGLYELFGVDPATYSSDYPGWLACVHPDDRERADRICTQATQDGKPYSISYRVLTPAGQVRLVYEATATSEDGSLMVGICRWIDRDLTETQDSGER